MPFSADLYMPRPTLQHILLYLCLKLFTLQGEITLVVEGRKADSAASEEALSDANVEKELQALMSKGISPSSAAKQVSKDLNLPKNRVYDLATSLKD